jgi:alanyl-tRNA synthetase
MTQRLYYNDSYLAEFTAKVVAVEGERVYLDRTAFYPTSGGQPHDLGELSGAKVVNVVDEEHRIAHLLNAPSALTPGAEVACRIEWVRRFDFMQQHTGQHLLSAIFEELFGHKTVSVHFGDAYSTLDLDTESLSSEGVDRTERRANDIVLENRPVTLEFEDSAQVSGLRKAVERTGTIRTVIIRDIDKSACGGTHVRSTGEIGPVVIRRVEKHKKLSRIEFLCGRRALARARADFDALSGMAATMTAAIDELPALIVKQAANLHAAESERRKLADELARYRARERYDATVPEADGVRRIVERAATLDELRVLAQAIAMLPKAVFVGATASPYAVVLAASEDSGVNAGTTLKAALAAHGGRGGGSPRVAQGTVGDAALLEAIVAALLKR